MITIEQTEAFADWLENLRDRKGQRIIGRRLAMVETGHFGDVKSVGDDVAELRIAFGPGYRIYFTRRGDKIVLLLIGGDKGSQDRDIAKAKEMATGLE